MSSEAYGAFAYAYDQALGEMFFKAARRMLDQVLERYPANERTHLDVACGTALAVEYFERKGYQSIGVDASFDMLAVGRKRAGSLVAGDFRALPFRRTFARITSLYDSLNHIDVREDLVRVFLCIRMLMADDSLFFFDMNHPDVYPAIWGMREPYVSTGPDHHLEIATKYRARDRIAHGLVTGWAKLPDGEEVKIREVHRQRAWSEAEIRAMLAEAGIEAIEVIDFDPFQDLTEIDAEGVKMFFVCGVSARGWGKTQP